MSEPMGFVATFTSLGQEVHSQLREEVSSLQPQALTWTPGPDTNSISTMIVHLLGSEAEVLNIVRGLPSHRDRESEFSDRIEEAQELLGRIDEADRLLEELAPQITEEDLVTARSRPSAVRTSTPRTGLFWLLNNYGHGREHLAHLQLTKQLFLQIHQAKDPVSA